MPANRFMAPDGLSRKRQSSNDTDDLDAEKFLEEFLGAVGEKVQKDKQNDEFIQSLVNLSFLFDIMDTPVLGYSQHRDADSALVVGFVPELEEFDSLKAMRIHQYAINNARHWAEVPLFDGNIYHGKPNWLYVQDRLFRKGGNYCGVTSALIRKYGDVDLLYYPMDDNPSPFSGALLRNENDMTYMGWEFEQRHASR